jgi:hypothetical protein
MLGESFDKDKSTLF